MSFNLLTGVFRYFTFPLGKCNDAAVFLKQQSSTSFLLLPRPEWLLGPLLILVHLQRLQHGLLFEVRIENGFEAEVTGLRQKSGRRGRCGRAGAATSGLDFGEALQFNFAAKSHLFEGDQLRLLCYAVFTILVQLFNADLQLLGHAQRVDELKNVNKGLTKNGNIKPKNMKFSILLFRWWSE